MKEQTIAEKINRMFFQIRSNDKALFDRVLRHLSQIREPDGFNPPCSAGWHCRYNNDAVPLLDAIDQFCRTQLDEDNEKVRLVKTFSGIENRDRHPSYVWSTLYYRSGVSFAASIGPIND